MIAIPVGQVVVAIAAARETPYYGVSNNLNRLVLGKCMPAAIIQNIDVNTLTIAERYALDILRQLSVDQVNQLKQRLKLGKPGVIGPQTLKAFIQLCQETGVELSVVGVNTFKTTHHLGNSGSHQGVIGPQTAGVYFDAIWNATPLGETVDPARSSDLSGQVTPVNSGMDSQAAQETAQLGGVSIMDENGAIATAAQSLFDMCTTEGPDGGNNACAWSVNQVLQKAGLSPLGDNPNYVPSLVDALKNGRGQPIDPDQAKPGDLAIAFGEAHIGIVLDEGGLTVLSNSSSRGRFRWTSSLDFDGYYGGPSTIYRLIC